MLLCSVFFFSHCIISPSEADVDSSRGGSDSPSVVASDANNAGCSSTTHRKILVQIRIIMILHKVTSVMLA